MVTVHRADYPGIPEDFPIEVQHIAVAGVRPKLRLIQQGETYYAPGTSPEEVQRDYAEMADLALQVVAHCNARNLETQHELDALLARELQVMQMHFGIRPSHAAWVMSRVLALLQEQGLDFQSRALSLPH